MANESTHAQIRRLVSEAEAIEAQLARLDDASTTEALSLTRQRGRILDQLEALRAEVTVSETRATELGARDGERWRKRHRSHTPLQAAQAAGEGHWRHIEASRLTPDDAVEYFKSFLTAALSG